MPHISRMPRSGFMRTVLIPLALMVVCIVFLSAGEAHAGYLDPGSGSTLAQVLVGIMAFFGKMVARIKGMLGLGPKND